MDIFPIEEAFEIKYQIEGQREKINRSAQVGAKCFSNRQCGKK